MTAYIKVTNDTEIGENLIAYKSMRITPNTVGKIYFLSWEPVGEKFSAPIKIGFTTRNIKDRVVELQTGNPNELICLCSLTGSIIAEKFIHRYFMDIQQNNEWYYRDEKLVHLILSIQQASTSKAHEIVAGLPGVIPDHLMEFLKSGGRRQYRDYKRYCEGCLYEDEYDQMLSKPHYNFLVYGKQSRLGPVNPILTALDEYLSIVESVT